MFFVSSRLPFPLRFHIELHTRKSFGSGFEGARYKFDVDMDMESNASAYLVPSSSVPPVFAANRSYDFRDALLGDRTVSDFVHGFNLKIVRCPKQYAKRAPRVEHPSRVLHSKFRKSH